MYILDNLKKYIHNNQNFIYLLIINNPINQPNTKFTSTMLEFLAYFLKIKYKDDFLEFFMPIYIYYHYDVYNNSLLRMDFICEYTNYITTINNKYKRIKNEIYVNKWFDL